MNRSRFRPCGLAVVLAVLWLSCGCCSFESRWKAAARAEAPFTSPSTLPASAGIDGRWEGTWRSEVVGHTGRLRCILTRSGPESWCADFHATFWKIFSFGYRVTLRGQETPQGGIALQGDSDLGWLAGGNYHYEGTATPDGFACTYTSKYDHGRFDMKPVGPILFSGGRPGPS